MTGQAVHVLLVEDDDVETEAIIRAFRKQQLPNPVTTVHDGIEAFKVLRGEDGSLPLSHPYLILLDLNTPRMSGLEFLTALRQDPNLRRSVVFILTTSNREEDKLAAYDRQVAGYLLKSNMGDDFGQLTNMLTTYWQVTEFPPEATSG